MNIEEKIQQELFRMQDISYQTFQQKLLPTVDPCKIIGVRTPILRKFARDFAKTGEAQKFLSILPHQYYEENNLHAFLIERISNYEETMRRTEQFLPYIDNWATCDSFLPKIFQKHPKEVYEKAKEFIQSDQTYVIRYGIGLLMKNFLEENFQPEMPELVLAVRSREYYVNMMCAWYMATALIKHQEIILPILREKRMHPWVHNKTIQKAIESRRITPELKAILRKMRQK